MFFPFATTEMAERKDELQAARLDTPERRAALQSLAEETKRKSELVKLLKRKDNRKLIDSGRKNGGRNAKKKNV